MPELGETKRGKTIGYGSERGYWIWTACEECGKERWVKREGGKPMSPRCKSCSHLGARHFNWNGGKKKTQSGYIGILVRPNDPYYPMAPKSGYVLEHRLVMAKHLERCLESWELVHHINGIKDDNQIENLELLPDAAKHNCINVLQKYIKELEAKVLELTTKLNNKEK